MIEADFEVIEVIDELQSFGSLGCGPVRLQKRVRISSAGEAGKNVTVCCLQRFQHFQHVSTHDLGMGLVGSPKRWSPLWSTPALQFEWQTLRELLAWSCNSHRYLVLVQGKSRSHLQSIWHILARNWNPKHLTSDDWILFEVSMHTSRAIESICFKTWNSTFEVQRCVGWSILRIFISSVCGRMPWNSLEQSCKC